MKVLHVHDFFAPGNSRFGFDLDRHLKARGHEVRTLAGVGALGPKSGDEIEGIRFHTYPYAGERGPVDAYFYSRRMGRETFEAMLDTFVPDALLFNQPLSANGLMGLKPARSMGRAYLYLSPWPREWEVEARRSGDSNGLLGKIQRGMRRRLEGKALRGAHRVLVISEYMDRELRREHPGVPVEKLRRTSGAVDLDVFTPTADRPALRRRLGIETDAFVVFTMRRLVYRMGVDLLINAVTGLLKTMSGLRLIVGGDGPERGELEKLAAELGAGPAVKFLGYVSDGALPDYYRAADVVLLPTRELEGFGLVLIESMACGTPAMGTAVGAIPEVLTALDPNLVVRAADSEAIAGSIARIAGDRPWREDLRKRCRAFVAERYDWRRVIVGVEKALEESLQNR